MIETPEQELVRLSQGWMAAWQQRDEVRLNQLMADGFTLASSLSAELMSREQWLDYPCTIMNAKRLRLTE